MNKIEQMFYDAFLELENGEDEYETTLTNYYLEIQKPVGIYKPDFICGGCVIEIDGHDYHKTKEQREKDYKRERYLMKQGYFVIRFMATEVYLNPKECVKEALEIVKIIEEKSINDYCLGFDSGIKKAMED